MLYQEFHLRNDLPEPVLSSHNTEFIHDEEPYIYLLRDPHSNSGDSIVLTKDAAEATFFPESSSHCMITYIDNIDGVDTLHTVIIVDNMKTRFTQIVDKSTEKVTMFIVNILPMRHSDHSEIHLTDVMFDPNSRLAKLLTRGYYYDHFSKRSHREQSINTTYQVYIPEEDNVTNIASWSNHDGNRWMRINATNNSFIINAKATHTLANISIDLKKRDEAKQALTRLLYNQHILKRSKKVWDLAYQGITISEDNSSESHWKIDDDPYATHIWGHRLFGSWGQVTL